MTHRNRSEHEADHLGAAPTLHDKALYRASYLLYVLFFFSPFMSSSRAQITFSPQVHNLVEENAIVRVLFITTGFETRPVEARVAPVT